MVTPFDIGFVSNEGPVFPRPVLWKLQGTV
jgi:hypothetical protein